MSKAFPDDTFLARWLNGELSQSEEELLQAREDYPALLRMAETSRNLALPPFSEGAAWEQLLQARKQQQSGAKRRKRRMMWGYAAAAAVAMILIGIAYWMYVPDTPLIVTGIGTQYEGELPDGSKVVLNAAGSIDYDAAKWPAQRTLTLQGEAFFTVEKGSTFTISTPKGLVEVLGTSFNVWAREEQLEVICYTGKVKVKSDKSEKEIVAEQKAVLETDGQFTITNLSLTPSPSWFRGWTECNGLPLSRVFAELSRRYAIKVVWKEVEYRIYDGGFPNDDLMAALKFICDPMELQYELSEDKKIVRISPK
ncbi:MAG: FecR domain-containing protein [Saprospiraceae bacterium]